MGRVRSVFAGVVRRPAGRRRYAIFLILFALILVVVNLGSWRIYAAAQQTLERELGERLTAIATAAAQPIDPGYVTEAKLILASTKDRDHRIYLDRGVFAENTLFYHAGAWKKRPWTYPDYQRADYHQFLTRCRDYYRQRLRK